MVIISIHTSFRRILFKSPFFDTDRLKMALHVRNISGAFEKRAPGTLWDDLLNVI